MTTKQLLKAYAQVERSSPDEMFHPVACLLFAVIWRVFVSNQSFNSQQLEHIEQCQYCRSRLALVAGVQGFKPSIPIKQEVQFISQNNGQEETETAEFVGLTRLKRTGRLSHKPSAGCASKS